MVSKETEDFLIFYSVCFSVSNTSCSVIFQRKMYCDLRYFYITFYVYLPKSEQDSQRDLIYNWFHTAYLTMLEHILTHTIFLTLLVKVILFPGKKRERLKLNKLLHILPFEWELAMLIDNKMMSYSLGHCIVHIFGSYWCSTDVPHEWSVRLFLPFLKFLFNCLCQWHV